MSTPVGTVVLVVGLVLTGLMAGLYFGFTTAVMPGLARVGDRAYVISMQRINASILNPWFLTTFLGALVVPVAAAVLHLHDDARTRLPWIIAGAALYGATVVSTGADHVPLNNRLMAVEDVCDQAAPEIRHAFQHRWTRFNKARTVVSLAAVVALAIALARPVV